VTLIKWSKGIFGI